MEIELVQKDFRKKERFGKRERMIKRKIDQQIYSYTKMEEENNSKIEKERERGRERE